jgi:hypothetical protein
MDMKKGFTRRFWRHFVRDWMAIPVPAEDDEGFISIETPAQQRAVDWNAAYFAVHRERCGIYKGPGVKP